MNKHYSKGILILFSGLFFLPQRINAQVVITADMVIPAETLIYRGIDFYPDSLITPGAPGLNTWDFSSLINESIDTIKMISPTSTPYTDKFPSATVCMKNKDGFTYYKKSSSGLEVVGTALDLIGNSTLLAIEAIPALTFIPFNATYLTSYSESVIFSEVLAAEDLNASSFDSILISGTLSASVVFDAYGTMIAPYDTMDVIRQKVVEVLEYKVYGKKYFAGQVLYTNLVASESSTETRYLWWSDSAGFNFPVAEMAVAITGVVRSVQFASAINVAIVEDIITDCKDSCDAQAFVLGGQLTYTYIWSDLDSQVADTATGLCAGDYQVTVVNKDGSYARLPFKISNASSIATSFAGHGATCETCNDGLTTIKISGGTAPYNVLWDSSANYQTTIIALYLVPGYYTVYVEDNNGCPAHFNTSIGIFEGILVYPNPADKLIRVFTRLDEFMILEIYSLSGEKLKVFKNLQSGSDIAVGPLNDGHYIYRLLNESGSELKTGHLSIHHP